MSRIKVPIVSAPYPTLDGIELDSNSISVNDGYIDEAKFFVKRPGLEDAITLPQSSPVDGLSYRQGEDLLIALCNQRIYTIDDAGTITDISSPNGAFLQLRNRPTFAYTVINNVNYMAVANGGRIYISIDGGDLNVVTDASAPTSVTHLVFMNNRLVANNIGTDQFSWSEFEDPFDWPALGFATAQGEPDQITALYKSWNEIALFGSNTIEFWYTTGDASAPFARMQGTQINQGTLSPDGIVFDGEDSLYYFIDSERNINILQNRTVKNISQPIEKLIQDLDVTTDARLDLVKIDAHKFILCTFPTDDITFVYDILTGYWCQWGEYKPSTGDYSAFLGRSLTWANKRGKNFAGTSASDGRIFTVDRDIHTDGGSSIRSAFLTGWIDCGTHQSKRWMQLLHRIKRQPTTGFTYQMRIRKDYNGSQHQERVITFDNSATQGLVKRIQNFGSARAIQFEVYCTEDAPFILGNFELEYTQNRY